MCINTFLNGLYKNAHENVHLCDSLVQFKMMMWLKEFIVSTQSVVLHR